MPTVPESQVALTGVPSAENREVSGSRSVRTSPVPFFVGLLSVRAVQAASAAGVRRARTTATARAPPRR
ncbi:hypothetical protein [Isoptericola croceus]|uniref:hypothetical protein n=1 Tax=Isoptericola croceus TaxID=3031406 RepID=UPI0023F62AE1|nr:hypothetical protein [Isoptericola croceus]